LHVLVWHWVSWPGQSPGARHSAQLPEPSQTTPLPSLHEVPTGSDGVDGTPALHTSPVHVSPSTGMSAFSSAFSLAPLPSHWATWQSPSTCEARGVPCGAKSNPHVRAMQVRVWHSVSCPEQSFLSTQPTHCPASLQKSDPFWPHGE